MVARIAGNQPASSIAPSRTRTLRVQDSLSTQLPVSSSGGSAAVPLFIAMDDHAASFGRLVT